MKYQDIMKPEPKKDVILDADEIKEVMEFYEKSRNYKEKISYKCYLNISAYLGEQMQWDKMYNKLVPDNKYSPYIPILFHNINSRISKITANAPNWEVEPEFSIDSSDEQIARVTKKLITHLEKSKKIQRFRQLVQIWNHLTGCCWKEIYWEHSSGKNDFKAYIDKDSEDIFGDNAPTGKNLIEITKKSGDVEQDIWNWFEVFIDTNLSRFEDAEKVVLVRAINNDKIKRMFGNKILEKTEADKSSESANNIYLGFGSLQDMLFNTTIKTQDTTLVYKIYRKSSEKYPKGQLAFIINNQFVYKGKNPCPTGKIPLIHRYNLETISTIWKKAIISDCRPLQTEFNSIRTQMRKTREDSGNMTVLVEDDSMIRVEQMKNYPITIIRGEFNANGTPKFKIEPRIQANGNDLQWQLGAVTDDLKNILSIRLSSERSYLAERTSGVALDKLNQADTSDLAWEITNIETQEIEEMVLMLEYIKEYYSPERIQECIGDTFVLGFKNLKKLISTILKIEPFSMLPRDIATKRKLLIELMNINPNFFAGYSLEKLLKEIEFGGLEDYYARNERQISKAMNENLKMMTGIYVEVNLLTDQHELELPVHEDFVKSKEFSLYIQSIAKKDIQLAYMIQENLQKHIAMTYQAIETRKQMIMQQNQQLAG